MTFWLLFDATSSLFCGFVGVLIMSFNRFPAAVVKISLSIATESARSAVLFFFDEAEGVEGAVVDASDASALFLGSTLAAIVANGMTGVTGTMDGDLDFCGCA